MKRLSPTRKHSDPREWPGVDMASTPGASVASALIWSSTERMSTWGQWSGPWMSAACITRVIEGHRAFHSLWSATSSMCVKSIRSGAPPQRRSTCVWQHNQSNPKKGFWSRRRRDHDLDRPGGGYLLARQSRLGPQTIHAVAGVDAIPLWFTPSARRPRRASSCSAARRRRCSGRLRSKDASQPRRTERVVARPRGEDASRSRRAKRPRQATTEVIQTRSLALAHEPRRRAEALGRVEPEVVDVVRDFRGKRVARRGLVDVERRLLCPSLVDADRPRRARRRRHERFC